MLGGGNLRREASSQSPVDIMASDFQLKYCVARTKPQISRLRQNMALLSHSRHNNF